MTSERLFFSLVGERLGSVIFVGDYVQLDFDGLRLTLWAWPTLALDTGTLRFGDPGYRDGLCALMGRCVTSVAENTGTGLVLHWDADSLTVDPAPDDLSGPEIAMLNGQTTEMTHGLKEVAPCEIWRSGEFPFDGPEWH